VENTRSSRSLLW